MKKKSQDKPLSPLEIALRDIAVAAGAEGMIIVSLRPETYPASTHFTFLRFDVKSENMMLNILVKAVQQDPELRTKYFIKEHFMNEVHFYSQCVPKIRPILDKGKEEESPKEVPVLLPNFYGHDPTEGQEWLAIEDIGPEYVVTRNVENLDKSHLKLRMSQQSQLFSNNTRCYTGNFLFKDLRLIMKQAIEDPDAREKHFVVKKFRNEVTFYDNVANRLEFVVKKRKRWTFNHWIPNGGVLPKIPNVYDSHLIAGKEFLLLEDLVDYSPCEHPQNLDKKHMKAAILALASFHSASLAWKINNPAEFATVARLFTETEMLRTDVDPAKDVKTQKINAALGAAARSCTTHLSGPYSVAAEKIYNSAFVECPSWVSMERAEPWSVITHGDCWAKNFLFKYDRNKKITGVALVDFKSARAASPVLDVTNFLLSSGSADCLKDLRPFIEKHKDSMTPKMADYRHHVRLFGSYGVVAALVHHYYGVLYPNLDVEEATSRITNLEDLRDQNDPLTEPTAGRTPGSDKKLAQAAKKSAGQVSESLSSDQRPKLDDAAASRLRVALVMKAAHDVRMI